MSDLSKVDTIVIVMLENRSFDHMLGHVSLSAFGNRIDVDGLREPLNQYPYENPADGETYYPFPMTDGILESDLPHERDEIAQQLAWSNVSGRFTMSGFVESYFATTPNRTIHAAPMGFLQPSDVPITNFFANNYSVCDRWFSSIPASTQPNRLMMLSGNTRIDATKGLFPPTDSLLTDWLSDRGVRWRVYHCGISFFACLGRLDIVFGENSRSIDRLAADVNHEGKDDFPSVIIIEPSYADAPHIGNDIPNCNHAPIPVAAGEQFLRQIYEALTCNPDRWSRTVMIVTYDEHGGFFDHVPPPLVPYQPAANAKFATPFSSLGVRVPSLVVSPLVSHRSVCSKTLDHTSILQLLAQKFAPGSGGFSLQVENRRKAGVASVADALDLSSPRTEIPLAPAPPRLIATFAAPNLAPSLMQQAFQFAATTMVKERPKETAQKYPAVSHWVLTQEKTT